MRSKKFFFFVLAAALAGMGGRPAVRGQGRRPGLPAEPFTAVVDGKIRTDYELMRFEETPFVSLRTVQRLFGGRQSWKRVSRQVTYRVEGHEVGFTLDSATAAVGGKSLALDGAVRAWSDHVFLPMSFLSTPAFEEITQTDVQWEAEGRVLSVELVPSVSSPRFYSYADKSRVVVELGPRVHHRLLGVRGTEMSVRFFGGRSRGNERLEVKDGLIESVSLVARSRSSDLMLRLSGGAGEPRLRLAEAPRRLEIEVFPKSAAEAEETFPSEGVSLPIPPLPVPALEEGEFESSEDVPSPARLTPLQALSPVRTVVIDPGHGGKDAGAVGRHGMLEKDANLRIARALARLLKRDGRYHVVMTRNDDSFVTLQGRSDIANKHKADLFISVHCNASLSRSSDGFEIYFLSEKATDDAAAAVARRENAVVELEGLSDKAKLKLSELLWSLARTETLNESSEVAALIARQVDKRVRIANRGVKQAGFYVLKGANMPAVLVEAAFISHPREEGLLRSARFQSRLADALYAGILDYEKRKIQAKLGKASAGGN